MDLSESGDLVLLRHLRRSLLNLWGEGDTPGSVQGGWFPMVLALLSQSALSQPDWMTFADDFLLPPYSADEARARLRMLEFRRNHITESDLITIHGITLDRSSRRVRSRESGEVLPLAPREFELLQFLIIHRGKLWSRERLLDLVWGINFEGGPRTVDIHIRRLRSKLPPVAASHLETHRGLGYGFA